MAAMSLTFYYPYPSNLLLINYLTSVVEMLINYFPPSFSYSQILTAYFRCFFSTACFGCLFQLLPIAVSDEGLAHKQSLQMKA